MSALVHIHGEFRPVRIEMDSDDATIWVRCGADSVSLDLLPHQLDALELAIKASRKRREAMK